MKNRVVVTGMGMLTPVGNDVSTSWEALVKGQNGISLVDEFVEAGLSTQFAARLKDFDITPYMERKDARKFDPFIQFGVAAAAQAIEDSGIEVDESNADRIGVCIAAGIGGISTIEDNHSKLLNRGPRRVSPFYIPGSIINMAAGQVSIMYGLKGPNISIVTACTTGLHNIGHAARMIAYGDADAMVAGGAEMTSTPLTIAGFSAAKGSAGLPSRS